MGHPSLKLLRLLCLDPVRHAPVLDAAELGALAGILALGFRLEPHPGLAVGKDVALGGKLRHPEAVNHVTAAHAERDRPPQRDVHLVRGGQVVLRVAELPPPLMSHDLDGQGIFAWNRAGLEDGLDRRDRDSGQDQGWNDRPDDLHSSVAVGLVGFRISRFTPKPEDGVDQNALHQHEHEEGPFDRGVQKIVGDPGEITAGKQCGLRIVLRTTAGQHQREQAQYGDRPERARGSGPEGHYALILLVRIRSDEGSTAST